jgi:hypothetical protein
MAAETGVFLEKPAADIAKRIRTRLRKAACISKFTYQDASHVARSLHTANLAPQERRQNRNHNLCCALPSLVFGS